MIPFVSWNKYVKKFEKLFRIDKLPVSIRSSVPHILLFILTVVYILLGAVIFRAVEIAGAKNAEKFENGTKIVKNHNATRDVEEAWSYSDSLLFCFVTITTIGYGNLAPKTVFGRFFLSVYSILGIPMLGICLADVGKFISTLCWSVLIVVQKLGFYTRRDAYGLKTKKPPSADQPIPFWLSFLIFVVYTFIGACLFPFYEQLGWIESFYFSFVSLTTIGYGDYYPENLAYLGVTLFYLTLGLALNMMALSVLGSMLQKMHYVGQPITGTAKTIIMFGGKELDLEEVIRLISKKLGVSESEVDKLIDNLDQVISDKVEMKEAEARGEETVEETIPVVNNNLSADDVQVVFIEHRPDAKLRRYKNLLFVNHTNEIK